MVALRWRLWRLRANTGHYVQITDPSGSYEAQYSSVSSGDYSFEARMDGKYVYCFSNEHWSANSKEVSFNVHGVVYVPESEAPQDPLEVEGQYSRFVNTGMRRLTRLL